MAHILSNAELVVANDSGPMHLASFVNDKVLGLFGVTDPKRTRPWQGNYMGQLGMWSTLEEVLKKVSSMSLIPIVTNPNINN